MDEAYARSWPTFRRASRRLLGNHEHTNRDRRGARRCAAGLPIAGSAQVKPGATAADVALYTGADRLQKLIEGAKKEGTVSVYTSAQTTDFNLLVAAFEKKYGVKVVDLARRFREHRHPDRPGEPRKPVHRRRCLETNGPELESLHRENILQLVKSPYLADLIAPAILPHGEWAGSRLNVFVQAYNTKLVKKADLPKTWEDLANPKWKGKLGIEQEDSDWLAGVFADIGDARGQEGVQGHRRRQRHLGAQGAHAADAARRLGRSAAGVDGLQLQGRAAEGAGRADRLVHDRQCDCAPNGVAVARKAPHPHAAVLFYDFELSPEGQQIIANLEFVPTSKKIDTPLNKVPMKFVDAKVAIDEYDKWKTLYRQLFGIRGS